MLVRLTILPVGAWHRAGQLVRCQGKMVPRPSLLVAAAARAADDHGTLQPLGALPRPATAQVCLAEAVQCHGRIQLQAQVVQRGERSLQMPDGGVELAARVTAVPEKGRANDALLRLLAKQFKLPVGRLRIVSGETDRHKQILIDGEAAALDMQLRPWLAGLNVKE